MGVFAMIRDEDRFLSIAFEQMSSWFLFSVRGIAKVFTEMNTSRTGEVSFAPSHPYCVLVVAAFPNAVTSSRGDIRCVLTIRHSG